MSKVYVAAPWILRERAIEAAKILEAGKHQITRKWWLYEDPASGPNGQGHATLSLYAVALAELDIKAVRDADAVVCLVPKDGGVGMWVEMGAALALGKPVYHVNLEDFESEAPRRSIFDNMVRRCSLVKAMEELKFVGTR